MAHLFRLIVAGLLLGLPHVAFAVCTPAAPSPSNYQNAICEYWNEANAWVEAGINFVDCGALYGPGHELVITNVNISSQARRLGECYGGPHLKGTFMSAATVTVGDEPIECTAGKKETGSYRIVDEANRPGGTLCLDGCEYNVSDEATEEVYWSEGGVGVYRLDGEITATGEQCGPGTDQPGIPELDEEPPNICYDIGHGFQQCTQDPLRCVRAPDGTRLCPDQPGPDCRLTPKHAACSDRPPPPDYDEPRPPITIEYCKGNRCGTIEMSSDEEEEDEEEECEPGDPDCDEEEDQPDCPPNDPDCEDDDDDNAPRAADSGCETETPSCSDMGHVDCQILIRTHRTNCTAAYGNKMLEEFRDRQIEEVRETNAKLKALKDTFILSTDGIVHTIEGEVGDRLKQVTEKLRDIQRDNQRGSLTIASNIGELRDIMATGTSVLVTTVDGQTLELGNKLDDVERAIAGLADNMGPITVGDVTVDQTEVVTAIGNQTAAIVGDGVDPGSGATEADLNAIQVRSVTNGPVSPDVINMQGFLGGGSCPDFGTFTLAGIPWQIDNTFWCDFLSIIKACMYLLAVYWSVMILLGK